MKLLDKETRDKCREKVNLVRRLQGGVIITPRADLDRLVGFRSGRLVGVEALLERSKFGSVRWKCRCDCGNEHIVTATRLANQEIRSCGCLRRENARQLPREKRTPWVGHPLYRVWAGIQRRTENPNDRSYRYYGARGVRMCDEWRKCPEAFILWATMAGWTMGNRWVVSRYGDVGDYEPSNCAMISVQQNARDRSHYRSQRVRRLW